jgi:hypothetical protein
MQSQSVHSTVAPDQIMQIGLGFWNAKALLSAIELGLFTLLADGALTADQIGARLGLHPRGTRDFFDSLVAMRMLERTDGAYSNSLQASTYLDRNRPEYIGGILEMANARLYLFWGSLTDALKTGEPQNEIRRGEQLFEAMYSEPARLKQFLAAMTGLSLPAARAIATKFPWADYRSFMDVGCAQGAVPVELALAHQHLGGTGFDLPVVRPIFEEYVHRFDLSDRVRFVEGSFFSDPLPHTDVIIMGHILHDWNLDEKRMLLAKAYEALPAGGALIVYEAMIDDDRRENAFGLLMSLNMLIETPGGFDYTGADCQQWMKEAGFRETRVEHLVGPDSMVIAVK